MMNYGWKRDQALQSQVNCWSQPPDILNLLPHSTDTDNVISIVLEVCQKKYFPVTFYYRISFTSLRCQNAVFLQLDTKPCETNPGEGCKLVRNSYQMQKMHLVLC